ncbi:hypothetical protein CPL00371_CDS0022 [Klebsiella phage MegaDucksbill]|uniref:Secreted protein n=1 Tax=Klebsiella phage MegaDucksbill TaxID=3098260 RepID=A0ABZ2ENP9_9CAUD
MRQPLEVLVIIRGFFVLVFLPLLLIAGLTGFTSSVTTIFDFIGPLIFTATTEGSQFDQHHGFQLQLDACAHSGVPLVRHQRVFHFQLRAAADNRNVLNLLALAIDHDQIDVFGLFGLLVLERRIAFELEGSRTITVIEERHVALVRFQWFLATLYLRRVSFELFHGSSISLFVSLHDFIDHRLTARVFIGKSQVYLIDTTRVAEATLFVTIIRLTQISIRLSSAKTRGVNFLLETSHNVSPLWLIIGLFPLVRVIRLSLLDGCESLRTQRPHNVQPVALPLRETGRIPEPQRTLCCLLSSEGISVLSTCSDLHRSGSPSLRPSHTGTRCYTGSFIGLLKAPLPQRVQLLVGVGSSLVTSLKGFTPLSGTPIAAITKRHNTAPYVCQTVPDRKPLS